ncbi:LysR substrate-binding domain-containing protein [Paucibacter sp. APW11]|uniref:LysR substrate-binding domain-containing protein n=1 Tax=Roseateles aquae TaxID=3077235 RepID=A0ABU3PDS7_9BURK|nr:LysR substrate-binding domain-containing protein [Paucibacter sp. APW11]MDT9000031.1 LysR substrate-binding domain-containing protein [Paucibacter sp. APW11]
MTTIATRLPDLKSLSCFVAVAEELHFGRAAQRLHLSQPPLSQQIIKLERLLGCQLLLRDRRSVTLTPAGLELLSHARQLLQGLGTAVQATRRVASGEAGELRLGYSGSALYSSQALDALAAYKSRYPAVDVQLREGVTRAHVDSVLAGRLDLAFVRGTLPIQASGLQRLLISQEPLLLALPVGHALAARRSVRVAELAGQPFVAFDRQRGTALNELLNQLFHSAGVEAQVVMQSSEMGALLGLVAAGVGLAIVPQTVAGQAHGHLRFVPLREAAARIELHLIAAAQPSAVAAHFIDLCTAVLGTGGRRPERSSGRTPHQ